MLELRCLGRSLPTARQGDKGERLTPLFAPIQIAVILPVTATPLPDIVYKTF
jgi:hypothetical protein